jgi:hypothetical protein
VDLFEPPPRFRLAVLVAGQLEAAGGVVRRYALRECVILVLEAAGEAAPERGLEHVLDVVLVKRRSAENPAPEAQVSGSPLTAA